MRKFAGWNLLEILIVLAIIGILIQQAFPVYSHYVIKAKRVATEVELTKIAAALERYYTEHQTYRGATLTNLGFDPANARDYQVTLALSHDDGFILTATPDRADSCGALSLNQLGERGSHGSASNAECWGVG